jgi:glutaredoxin-related protein
MISEDIKILIETGIIRERFVREADKATLASIKRFAENYSTDGLKYYCDWPTIGMLLIQHGYAGPG